MKRCSRAYLVHALWGLFVLAWGILGVSCSKQTQYATPVHPVHYRIYFDSAEGQVLIPMGGWLSIRQPNVAYSAIGFGGILLVHGFTGYSTGDNYYAYDLACPHELDPKVSLMVNSKLEAECPKCHSRYDIIYGGGGVLSGPSQSPLLPYQVLPIDRGLLITTPHL